MLLRFLSVTGAMCLGACAAVAAPDTQVNGAGHRSDSHAVRLPCAPCSFVELSCSQDTKPNAYLTVEFTMENGTLFANNDAIFPVPTPMQFAAVRHWDSSTSRETEDVVLEYALNVQQLPPYIDAVVGDVYRLTMKLVDLHGRPATPNLVTIGIVRNTEAKLLISHIQMESAQRHGSLRGNYKMWKMKYWKTQVGAYLVTVKEAVKNNLPTSYFGTKSHHAVESEDPNRLLILDAHRHPSQESEQELDPSNTSSDDDAHFQILSFYQYNYASPHGDNHRHFLRLVRPIIFPALLGVLAGFVACVIGFGLGKFAAAAYFHGHGRGKQVATDNVVDEEEGELSEKQRLMAIFSEA